MKKKVVSCLLAAAMVVSSGAAVPGFFFTPEKVQLRQAKQRLIPHRRLRRLMEIKVRIGAHHRTK